MDMGQEYLLNVLDKRYKGGFKVWLGGQNFKLANYNGAYTWKNASTSITTKANSKSATPKYMRLILAEINGKKKLGLCFHHDEKLTPRHDCRRKKLFLIMDEMLEQGIVENNEDLALIWEVSKKDQLEIKVSDATIPWMLFPKLVGIII